MQARVFTNVFFVRGLLLSLLIQASCTHRIPDTEQRTESSDTINKVAVAAIRPQEPSADQISPVTASLRAEPAEIRSGTPFTLLIDVHISAGWHIYATDGPSGIALPTRIRLQSPTFIEETDGWSPTTPPIPNLQREELCHVHYGNVTFRCPVRVSNDAPRGAARIQCVLEYQACDRFTCQPPENLTLTTEVMVLP